MNIDKMERLNSQTVIRRRPTIKQPKYDRGVDQIVSALTSEGSIPTKEDGRKRQREFKQRYGKRFLTIRGRAIVADYLRDDTVTLYVLENKTGRMLPVVQGVKRSESRNVANMLVRFIEAYETIEQCGKMMIEINPRR